MIFNDKVFFSRRAAKNSGTANVGKENLYKTIAETNKEKYQLNELETIEQKINKLKSRIRRSIL